MPQPPLNQVAVQGQPMRWCGHYSPNSVYSVGDVVIMGDGLFISQQNANFGNIPPQSGSANWWWPVTNSTVNYPADAPLINAAT